MDNSNNLQLIPEHEGENNFNATQDMQDIDMDNQGGDQTHQIENDINLIQQ